jgi:hypothetical protein
VNAVEAGHNKGANEKTDSRQRQQRRERQAYEAERGEQGFAGVFHATRIKILSATCNSAFSGQFRRSKQDGETKTKFKKDYAIAHT